MHNKYNVFESSQKHHPTTGPWKNYLKRNWSQVQKGWRPIISVQFSSVTQSRPTLCNPMTVACQASLTITNSWSLLKLMFIKSVMTSNYLILWHPLLLLPSIFPNIRIFFTSGGQSIGASASASVLPVNIQDWFPSGWTGWISLQSKGLSRIFPNTTVERHQFVGAQLYGATLTSIHDYWKNHSLD